MGPLGNANRYANNMGQGGANLLSGASRYGGGIGADQSAQGRYTTQGVGTVGTGLTNALAGGGGGMAQNAFFEQPGDSMYKSNLPLSGGYPGSGLGSLGSQGGAIGNLGGRNVYDYDYAKQNLFVPQPEGQTDSMWQWLSPDRLVVPSANSPFGSAMSSGAVQKRIGETGQNPYYDALLAWLQSMGR